MMLNYCFNFFVGELCSAHCWPHLQTWNAPPVTAMLAHTPLHFLPLYSFFPTSYTSLICILHINFVYCIDSFLTKKSVLFCVGIFQITKIWAIFTKYLPALWRSFWSAKLYTRIPLSSTTPSAMQMRKCKRMHKQAFNKVLNRLVFSRNY